MDTICRIKPTVLDKNREKFYSKLATKGVVQLFNAVRDHQKNVKTKLGEVGKSTRKREEVKKQDPNNGHLCVRYSVQWGSEVRPFENRTFFMSGFGM